MSPRDIVYIHASGKYAKHLKAALSRYAGRVVVFDFSGEPSESHL